MVGRTTLEAIDKALKVKDSELKLLDNNAKEETHIGIDTNNSKEQVKTNTKNESKKTKLLTKAEANKYLEELLNEGQLLPWDIRFIQSDEGVIGEANFAERVSILKCIRENIESKGKMEVTNQQLADIGVIPQSNVDNKSNLAGDMAGITYRLARIGKTWMDYASEQFAADQSMFDLLAMDAGMKLVNDIGDKYNISLAKDVVASKTDEDDKKNTTNITQKPQGTGKFLDSPATKNGTLNIGAGKKPIEDAYNIDLNPSVTGVHAGDATNLSNITTRSQSKLIMQNPYGYNALNPEVSRVLQQGGTIEMTGGMSNRFFNRIYNMSAQELQEAGYSLVSKGQVVSAGPAYTTTGEVIKSTTMEIVLRKN